MRDHATYPSTFLTYLYLQGSAKEWSLGCVTPLAAGARFTQPWDHSLADPCTSTRTVLSWTAGELSAEKRILAAFPHLTKSVMLVGRGAKKPRSYVPIDSFSFEGARWTALTFFSRSLKKVITLIFVRRDGY